MASFEQARMEGVLADGSEAPRAAAEASQAAAEDQSSTRQAEAVVDAQAEGVAEARAEPSAESAQNVQASASQKEEPCEMQVEAQDNDEGRGAPLSETAALAAADQAVAVAPAENAQAADTPEVSAAQAPAETASAADTLEVPSAQDMQPMDVQGEGAQVEPEEQAQVSKEPSDPKTPPAKASKAKQSKTSSLEAAAARVKSLQEQAALAEADIAEDKKKVEDLQTKIAEMEALIATKRKAADAKLAAVQKASQDYLRQQCQAAIAHLEAAIPKRPPNPFVMFRVEISNDVKGGAAHEQSKIVAERWADLPEAEKQKYQDRHSKAMRKWREWEISEEGTKNLRERNELIRKCKANSKEELDSAIQAADVSKVEKVSKAKATPAKRTKKDAEAGEAPETPAKDSCPEMPAKQRRVSAGKSSAPTKERFLSEQILQEAGKADMVAQLQNLASRPEVLALGKTPQELLDILIAKNGMVNAAKHALLSPSA